MTEGKSQNGQNWATHMVSLHLNNTEWLYNGVLSAIVPCVEVNHDGPEPIQTFDIIRAGVLIRNYVVRLDQIQSLPKEFLDDMKGEDWEDVDWEDIASEFEELALEG
jgi:hypothetical protein